MQKIRESFLLLKSVQRRNYKNYTSFLLVFKKRSHHVAQAELKVWLFYSSQNHVDITGMLAPECLENM